MPNCSADGLKPPAHGLVVAARQHQRQENVVLKGEGIQQVKVLEYESQMRTAEGCQISLADVGEGLAV